MEIKIDDKKYVIDVKKSIELGVLKEEKKFSLMPERIKGGRYWYIGSCRRIGDTSEDYYDSDNGKYDCGNYFKTKEVAQYVLDNNLNPFNKLHNYIAHKNVEIGWKPDWNDFKQLKHHLEFDHKEKSMGIFCTCGFDALVAYSIKEVIEELRDKLNNLDGDE